MHAFFNDDAARRRVWPPDVCLHELVGTCSSHKSKTRAGAPVVHCLQGAE